MQQISTVDQLFEQIKRLSPSKRRLSEAEIAEQRTAFADLLTSLGPPATDEAIATFLASRDIVEPTDLLERAAVAKLQARLREVKHD